MVQSSHLCLTSAKLLLHGDDAGAMAKIQEVQNYYDLSNVHHEMGNVYAARGQYPQSLGWIKAGKLDDGLVKEKAELSLHRRILVSGGGSKPNPN